MAWRMAAAALCLFALNALPLVTGVTFPTASDLGVLKAINQTLKLSSWQPTKPCSSWANIDCEGGRVVSLILGAGKSLNGPLPPNFGNLDKLQNFNAPGAGIKGPFPASFQNLVYLDNLVLNDNQMTGTIPAGFSKLKKLVVLELRNNKFSGVIPYSLTLPNLGSVDLSFNGFYGNYPPGLVGQILNIDNNQFSGLLPSKFPLDTASISAQNNYFIGSASTTIFGKALCISLSFLKNNCLNYKPKPLCTNYVKQQRSSSDCNKFCGATLANGPCNGNGACQLTGAKNVPACVCNSGYKSALNGTIPTCSKA